MATNISYTLGSVIYLFAYSRITGMKVIEILNFSRDDWGFLARVWERLTGIIFRKR